MKLSAIQLLAVLLCVSATLPAALPAFGEDTRQGLLTDKRRAKAERLEPYEVSSGEGRVLAFEQMKLPAKIFVRGWHGIRPIIGGAPQGAGFLVYGLGYTRGLDSEFLRFDVNARTSTNNYQILDAAIAFPTEHSQLPFRTRVDGSWRSLGRIAFYGIGNDSPNFRSFYRLKDNWGRVSFEFSGGRWFDVAARSQYLSVRTSSSDRDPKIEDLDPALVGPVPGFFDERTDYVVNTLDFATYLRDRGVPSAGVTLHALVSRYEDLDGGRYDFSRLIGEVVAHVPLGFRSRVLAARAYTSHSVPDAGGEVPFYLMEAVGGARTLRGFKADRFVDRRNVQFNFEYRWEVWTYTDFALFYDTAKVFRDDNDLDFSGMHDGYGLSIRIRPPGNRVLRLEFGHSREGLQFYFASGDARY